MRFRLLCRVALYAIGFTTLTTAGCRGGSRVPDASRDAGPLMDAGSTPQHSPHYVPSNETELKEAVMRQYSAAEAYLVASCECAPADFGAESPMMCPSVVGGNLPDPAAVSRILACLADSFAEAAILANLNELISYERTTTACIRADGCAADCDFEVTPRLEGFLEVSDTCQDAE